MNANFPYARLRPEAAARVIEKGPHLVWTSDRAGYVHAGNESFGAYVCQSAENLVGLAWPELVRSEDWPRVEAAWCQIEENVEFEVEARLKRGDGVYRSFVLRAMVQDEEAQKMGGFQETPDFLAPESPTWIFMATEIEAQRVLQRDFDSILRGVPDVISRVNRDRIITAISSNVTEKGDWTLDTFVGKTPNQAPLWDNQETYNRVLDGVFEGGVEADFEYEHRDRVYRARLLPEKNERGEVESVLSITEDLTDLRRQETAARHHSELFEGISHATPGMIYVFDLNEQRATFVSGGVTGVLGYSPTQMQSLDARGIQELIHPDDYPRLLEERRNLVASNGEVLEIEHRVRHADGSWRWLHARDVLFSRDANGAPRQILGVAIDITRRRETETALRGSEERLRRVMDAVQLGTWEWFIAEGRILWNEWHWRLFGLEPRNEERRYDDFARYVHPDDLPWVADRLQDALRHNDGFQAEFRVIWPDGSHHWISGHGHVTELNEQGQPVRMNGIISDVTARKAAEAALQRAHDELEIRVAERTAQLQNTVAQLGAEVEQRREAQQAHRHLLSRLVNMQEEERRRLSRELHDQFGQTLTAMLMTIDAGSTSKSNANATNGSGTATDDPSARAQLRLRGMVEELMDQIHQRAWELRPASLDNVGLVAALRQLLDQWHGGQVDFVTRGFSDLRLPPPLEIAFYRVVQEALTNIARHAGASQTSVVLEKNEAHIVAIVEDDGKGFDLERVGEARLGMLGMRERMEAVGGTLEIETAPDKGTSVFARAPLAAPQNPTEERK